MTQTPTRSTDAWGPLLITIHITNCIVYNHRWTLSKRKDKSELGPRGLLFRKNASPCMGSPGWTSRRHTSGSMTAADSCFYSWPADSLAQRLSAEHGQGDPSLTPGGGCHCWDLFSDLKYRKDLIARFPWSCYGALHKSARERSKQSVWPSA